MTSHWEEASVSNSPKNGLSWENIQNSEIPLAQKSSQGVEERKSLRRRPAYRLLLAIALAAITTGIQFCAAQSLFGTDRATGSLLRVAVAAQDVPAHRVLMDSDIAFREVSGEQCLSALVAESEGSLLAQKGVAASLEAGAFVFRDVLEAVSTRRRLLSEIPAGRQLYELDLANVRLARSLRAGDRVDVVGNMQLPEKGFVTRTLLLGAILAGLEIRNDGASVFFFLDKKDTEFITHAKRFGELVVLARNATDTSTLSAGEGMTQSQFLNDDRIRSVYENDLFQIHGGSAHDTK
jgi:hypothetical protein